MSSSVNCLIVQSGGPSAAMNASASGLIAAAMRRKTVKGIWAAANGFEGILEDRIFDLRAEKRSDLRALGKAPGAALWVAGELIRLGVDEDLLRSHFRGVNPGPADTALWLDVLLQRFLRLVGFNPSSLRGRFSLANTLLPALNAGIHLYLPHNLTGNIVVITARSTPPATLPGSAAG